MGTMIRVLASSAIQQFRTSIGRPMFRFCVVAQPLIFGLLLGFIYLESSPTDFTLYAVFGSGLSAFWSSICFSSASDIHRERWYGTLEIIYAAPAGFSRIVLGKILGNTLWGLFSVLLSLMVVLAGFGKTLVVARPLWLLLGLTLLTIALVAIAYLFAALFTLSRSARVLMNFMEYPVYILCGMLFPQEALPAFLLPLSALLAPAWAIRILRLAILGAPNQAFLPLLGWLLALTLAYIVLALRMFSRIDQKCRVDATLEVY